MAQTCRAADWAAFVIGGITILIGLVLGAGGAWLLWLGGSFYYLPSGIVLVVSAVLLARRRVEGAWLYLLLFLLTVAWAF